MPSGRFASYVCGTNGAAFVPSANLPVRLYSTAVTGYVGPVVRCTGGQENLAIGIAQRGVLTTGLPVAVADYDGHQFLGLVNTTVAQGDKLRLLNSTKFRVVATAGARCVARVVKPRTNAGLTWLEYVPNGVV